MFLTSTNDQTIRKLADDAEARKAMRDGLKRPAARARLAEEWSVSFWSLTNFRRGRLKELRGTTRNRILTGITLGIEREIRGLEHELVLARKCHSHLSETKISQAAAALEQARIFIKGASK